MAKASAKVPGKNDPSPAKESLFGLDIDILKSLQLDHLIEEQKAGDVQKAATADTDIMNKTMTELREEHGMEPGLNTAANKLRRRCTYYKTVYDESEDQKADETNQ